MSIEEIIYSCNNEYSNSFYSIYSLVIKKYLLNLLINKKTLHQYEDCINYFIKINDINFKDSLEDIRIAQILYNTLNDKNVYIKFHKNEIIILDSINLFNQIYNVQTINYSLENINLEFKLEFNIDNLSIPSEIISYIDNIYYIISGYNNCIFNQIYKKEKNILQKKKIEINKRIKEILLIIKKIYKLVLNETINIHDPKFDRIAFINSLSIISIIKLKTKDVELNNEIIKEVLLIFNGNNQIKEKEEIETNESQKDTIESSKDTIISVEIENKTDSEYETHKNNILNVIKMYDLLYIEFGNETEDFVEFIERLFNEYDILKEILETTNENFMDNLLINFISEFKEFIELNEKILEDEINILKEFIRLTLEIIDKVNDEFYNIGYYENIYKIQLCNFKMKQTINTQNNISKLNNELKEISEAKDNSEIQKISDEIEKEIEKNNQIINSYNNEIQKIKNYSNTQSEEDDNLDDELLKINKYIDELIYYYNDKHIEVSREEIVELFQKCGIKYDYVKFNGFYDIFNNIEIFMKFINNLSIIKKEITRKDIELFIVLFNYKKLETYDLYINRIKEDGLTFYNNKFKLNMYEINILLTKIGFFIKDLIEKIDN
jgi:hypothetical protein